MAVALKKLDDGVVDATLLALAGLNRLGRAAAATSVLEVDSFLPAVGHGAIGIEARADDRRTRDLLAAIDDPDTLTAIGAERAFLAVLELRRAGELVLEQAAPFAPIRVARATQEKPRQQERAAAWTARSA